MIRRSAEAGTTCAERVPALGSCLKSLLLCKSCCCLRALDFGGTKKDQTCVPDCRDPMGKTRLTCDTVRGSSHQSWNF